MPRYPKKSLLLPTQPTFPCPVQGCRTQVRSSWGFTQHVGAKHPGLDLQYPGYERDFVQLELPSSDSIMHTSSPGPPLSPNPFSPHDIRVSASDWDPSDFDLDDAEPIPVNLDPSESDLGSLPADSTEFHPLINGMLSITLYYNF